MDKIKVDQLYINTENRLIYKIVKVNRREIYFKYGQLLNNLKYNSIWDIESIKPPLFVAFTKAQEYLYL